MFKYHQGVTHETATVDELIEMMSFYFEHYPFNPEQGVLKTTADFIVQCVRETDTVPSLKADVLRDHAAERASALTQLRVIADIVWAVMNRHALEYVRQIKTAIGYYDANTFWQHGFNSGYTGLPRAEVGNGKADCQQLYDFGHSCGQNVQLAMQYHDNAEHELRPWLRGFCAGHHTLGFDHLWKNPYSGDDPGYIDWDAGWLMGNELYCEKEN